jgi:uncharacterized lipoprotein YddW (UPF0748 family)
VKFSQHYLQALLIAMTAIGLAVVAVLASGDSIAGGESAMVPVAYLPQVSRPLDPMVEVRGLWVTRFDWTYCTGCQPAKKEKIDEIVNNASRAGFNAIFFQVRGVADAYYTPGPEPWARPVSGVALGVAPNPYWDPLAYFVEKAHEKGIELHAYINVYPVWNPCNAAPPHTTPQHFYYKLIEEHGVTQAWPTPASIPADNHYLDVARHLADNYAIDGLHLDHIRYGSRYSSCDPVSASASGMACLPATDINYQNWQRAQVNGTVRKFYNLIRDDHPEMMLSAAVWPTYKDHWGWGYTTGFSHYYQDSQRWIKEDYIDALMPMIYSSTDKNPDPNKQNFRLSRWRLLVDDYQRNSGGRFIIAGVGSNHYSSFAGIEDRIEAARELGTAGHAIFSYGGLKDPTPGYPQDYFRLLAEGPYARPARLPSLSWRN